MMAKEKIYELAFRFKEAKLWKRLTDSDLFAVRLSDGEIAYCSVMGMAGEHFALAAYVGEKGIQTYFRLNELDHDDPLDMAELPSSQECLMCSFENKDFLSDEEIEEVRAYAASVGKRLAGSNAFPLFTKYQMGRYPWFIETAEDTRRMAEVLDAALWFDQALQKQGSGFWMAPEQKKETTVPAMEQLSLFGDEAEPEPEPIKPEPNRSFEEAYNAAMQEVYGKALPLLYRIGIEWTAETIPLPNVVMKWPRPRFTHRSLAEYLKKAKKKGVWECGTMRLPLPVQLDDAEQEAPYYPLLLVSVKHANGRRLDPPIRSETGDPKEMLMELTNCLRDVGCPKTILAGDDRCYAMLQDLCQKIGIELKNTDEPRYLYEAMEDLLSEEEEDDLDDNEKLEDLIGLLMELPDEALRDMPPYLKRDLNRLAEADMLPDALKRRLK